MLQPTQSFMRVASNTSLILGCLLLGLVSTAQAQNTTEIAIEHFEPMPSQGNNILNTATSDVLRHLNPSFGLFMHYVDDPLLLVNTQDNTEVNSHIIGGQFKTELWASIGLFDVGELGIVLPLIPYQDGGDLGVFGRPGEQIDGFSISDLRIVPKIRVLNPKNFGGFGVAIVAPLHVPVGDKTTFNSDGEVRWEPRLVLDWQHPVGLTIAGNIGYQLRPERTSQNILSDDVIRWSVGAELPTGLEDFQIIASVFGNGQLQGDRDPANAPSAGANQSSPAEALAGLQFGGLPYNLVANIGGGAGLTRSIGSPNFRIFASIGYTPRVVDTDGDGVLDPDDGCINEPEDKDDFEDSDGCPEYDNDKDKILDKDDQCKNDPEDYDKFQDEDGCPDDDNDQDKIPDKDDKCPDVPGLAKKQGCPNLDRDDDKVLDKDDLCPDNPEDYDEFQDEDGCPDKDNDKDGIPDTKDKCKNDPEDFDKFQDEDGCPDLDNDKDGIPDTKDKCPLKPETYNGNKDKDGCPDGKQTVVITETEIRILQKVYFDTGKAKIKRKSYRLLNTVAVVLNQNKQVTKIRVDGHTDDMGKDEKNLDLSKRRARSVLNYLVKKGVDENRLDSEGFGETSPICDDIPERKLGKRSRKYKRCRADNRRVEFKIVELNGKPVSAADTIKVKNKKVVEESKP